MKWLTVKFLPCIQQMIWHKDVKAAHRLLVEAYAAKDMESVKHLECFKQTKSAFYIEAFLQHHKCLTALYYIKNTSINYNTQRTNYETKK